MKHPLIQTSHRPSYSSPTSPVLQERKKARKQMFHKPTLYTGADCDEEKPPEPDNRTPNHYHTMAEAKTKPKQ